MKPQTIALNAALLLGAATIFVACNSPGDDSTRGHNSSQSQYMSFQGDSLERPVGYREWVFVGEPVTPNDMNGGKAAFPEFHSVYMDPESFEHYELTGEFRDETILVKELISVGSKQAVSGNGYFMGDFIGLEATVKSSKRFPNEPGNWAYFSFTDPAGGTPKAKADAFPTASCNACHDASAADDFVFTQYYPVLSAAKGKGKMASSRKPFSINSEGVLKRPVGYRKWVFVGEPVTPNSLNNGKAAFPEMHSVYINPESYKQYQRTGKFPDGTILVKELLSVGSTEAVSGKGFFMGDFIGLEATVKSSKHFPNEPGNWAYFSFTTPEAGKTKPSASAFPTASCNACHAASAADDFVFTQYYPVLGKSSMSKMASSSSEGMASKDQWVGTKPAMKAIAGMPLGKTELFSYLKSEGYKSFRTQQGGTHPGRGPHTSPSSPVRVFYNDTLADSFAAGNAKHPKGAIAIKEMFTQDGQLQGWAVMAKTGMGGNGGEDWFWYEVTSSMDPTAIAAYGNGVSGCIGCHSVGDVDMIVSGYPLR